MGTAVMEDPLGHTGPV